VGEKSLQYARTLNNLGSLNEEKGNYDKAEPFYQQALAIFTATSGKDGPTLPPSEQPCRSLQDHRRL